MWWSKRDQDARPHSYDVNQKAFDLMVRLRPVFGETTNAGVLRKALALASVIERYAEGCDQITITFGDYGGATKDGKPAPAVTVSLRS